MSPSPLRHLPTAIAATLLGLVLLLALPPVQVRLVTAAASAVEGVELEAEYLWAGPRGVALKDLRLTVERAGLDLRIGEAEIDFAFWSSLAGFGLDIEAAILRDTDVDLDLTRRAARGDGFRRWWRSGIGTQAQVPRWLALRRLDATGSLLIKPAPRVEIAGPWVLSVASLMADAPASASLGADIDTRRLGERLASAAVRVEAAAGIDAEARITDFDLTADIDPLNAQPGLRAVAAVTLDPGSERYELGLTGAAGARLAEIDALLEPGGLLDATWEANLTPGVVAAFARGRSTADLSGSSTGRVRAELADLHGDVRLSAEFLGSGWEAFDPRLAAFGPLAMNVEMTGAFEPGLIFAETVRIGISSTDRGELLSVGSLQPFRYETGDWLVDPETWGEPALRIRASGLPLRWLRQLSPAAKIESGEFSGTIEFIRERERSTELLVPEPLRVTGLRLAPARSRAAPVFDMTLVPHVSLSNGVLQAEIEDLTITAQTGFRVSFQGQASTSKTDWPRAEMDANVSANVPALKRVIPQLSSVRGSTHLEFDFETLAMYVTAATLGADSVDGRELLSMDLSAQRALSVQLPQFAVDWDSFESRTATLRLDRAPIEWVGAYVPELEFRGGELSGQLSATRTVGQGVTLEADEPLRIANVLPVFRGRPASGTLTATVRPRVRLNTERSSIAIEELSIVTSRGNELSGDIALEASADSDAIAMTLSLDANLSELASRYGLRIGRLHWRQAGRLDPALKRFTLDEMSLDLEDSTGEDIVLLESLRPFSISVEPFGVAVDGGSPDILRATVTPLRFEQLLPNVLDLELEGTLPEGEFFGRAEPDGSLVLAADEALVFRDVSVRWEEAALLDRVTASVRYEVSYSEDGVQARNVDLTATDSEGSMLLHTTSMIVAPLNEARLFNEARLTAEADLELLARQPVLADLPHFSRGVVSVSVEAVDDAESALAFDLSLRNAATEAQGELPDVDLQLDAEGVRGEHISFTMPMRMESEVSGVSDLRVDGSWSADPAGPLDLEAALIAERLAAADLQQFMALIAPRDEEPPAEPRRLAPLSEETLSAIAKLRAQRHQTPFWTDQLLARASVEVGRVALPSFDIEEIGGRLEVTPDGAALSDVRALMLGAELTAAANLEFDAARPKPYMLDFHAELDALELERFFRAVSPDAAPTAEGRFTLTSTLTGSGSNPLDLGLSALGTLRLTGRDGVFRGLAARAGTGSTAARAIGILTFSRELRAIGRMLDGLGEIRFEQADVLLERETPDRIGVSNLFVRSPQLQISASGSLALAPQRPLLLSPMDVSVQLAASGDVEILFDGMGLLEEEVNDAGYRDVTRVIHVGGTPVEPDTSEFWELLEEAANDSRGVFGAGLRALNRRLESRED